VLKRTAHLTVRVSEHPQKIVAATAEGEPKRRPRAGAVKKSAPAKRAAKAKT
jgi:hypothetical protein